MVLTHPLTLCGLALDTVGWVASRFALHTLPVFAVQTMLAGSLAVTVLAARVAFGTRLRRETQAAIVLAMVGLSDFLQLAYATAQQTATGER